MADAGTVNINRTPFKDDLSCVVLEWTADASGNATKTFGDVNGTIERIVFVPSATSGVVPDSGYDVTLTDDNGIDVFSGKGANLSAASSTSVLETGSDPVLPFATCGQLDLSVSNAGNASQGIIRIYVRR